MKKASVSELHLKTSALIKDVVEGQAYVIELRGKPVAELRPISGTPPRSKPLPNRETWIRKLRISKTIAAGFWRRTVPEQLIPRTPDLTKSGPMTLTFSAPHLTSD
jgi:antitoxin (DNA-binding transcriptional repressor) of toxin-antitoxin stability system